MGMAEIENNEVPGMNPAATPAVSAPLSQLAGGVTYGRESDLPIVQNMPDYARGGHVKSVDMANSLVDQGAFGAGAATKANINQTAGFGMGANIAGTSKNVNDTLLQQQQQLIQMAQNGGAPGVISQAQQAMAQGALGYGASGTLGSARQGVQNAAIAEAAGQKIFQNQLQANGALNQNLTGQTANIQGTAGALTSLGGVERGITQENNMAPVTNYTGFASAINADTGRQTSPGATPSAGK